jgi:hypothetical protein
MILTAERLRWLRFGSVLPVVDLGREHHGLAAAAALLEPSPEDLLRAALGAVAAVDVGRVEKVDPELESSVHDPEAVGLAGLRAEVHGSEAQVADEHPVLPQSAMFDSH